MTLAIHQLLEDAPVTPSEVESFLSRHEFPLVEGASVTFVYRGEAEAVELRHWIYGLPATRAFQHVEGTDLWYLVQEIPPGSRIEYKLRIRDDGRWRLVRDRRNPRLAHDPFGANSVIHGEGYEVPEWTLEDPESRPGKIVDLEVESRVLGESRPVSLYLPARMRPTRRYPLLIVHDGLEYLRYADLRTVLDNLIHRLEIPSVVAALIHSPTRLVEYGADVRHARFVTEELLPELDGSLPLRPGPAGRCLMGASFGAVAALFTAWRTPGVYGRLLLQSGSFAFTDIGESRRGEAFGPVVDFVNRFRDAPGRPAERIFVSCGVYESLIYENRSLVPLLERSGMQVRYVEARDGHNWENWRDRLREGLSWLFPGPLWMVYE